MLGALKFWSPTLSAIICSITCSEAWVLEVEKTTTCHAVELSAQA